MSIKRSGVQAATIDRITLWKRGLLRCDIINLSRNGVEKAQPWARVWGRIKKLEDLAQREMMGILFKTMKSAKLPVMRLWLNLWHEAEKLPIPERKEMVDNIILTMKVVEFSANNVTLLFNEPRLGRRAKRLAAYLMRSYLVRRMNVRRAENIIKMMAHTRRLIPSQKR